MLKTSGAVLRPASKKSPVDTLLFRYRFDGSVTNLNRFAILLQIQCQRHRKTMARKARKANGRLTLLSLQVLLFPFLLLVPCSSATLEHAHLHRRASTYANHAPVLNESRHDSEFFTFLSVRPMKASAQCSQQVEVFAHAI